LGGGLVSEIWKALYNLRQMALDLGSFPSFQNVEAARQVRLQLDAMQSVLDSVKVLYLAAAE
jgi:hypothetical protein